MKKILFIAFAFISFSAFSQDTSSAVIRLNLPQSAFKFMGSYLPVPIRADDVQLIDSLKKGRGSGTSMDSLSLIGFKCQTFFEFTEKLCNEQAGASYDYITKLYTWTLAANGYAGVLAQLTTKAAGNTSEKGAAIWLKAKILDIIARMQGPFNDKLNIGDTKINTTRNFN